MTGIVEASLDIQATRAHIYALRARLPMFVVYRDPEDWPPGFFVAVLWTSLPEPERSDLAIGDRNLERLQTTMEALGLTKLMRSEGDDPVILETWI